MNEDIKQLLAACESVAEDYSMGIDNMIEFPDEADESRELLQEMRDRMEKVKQAFMVPSELIGDNNE